jgi:hypothetical protein
VDLEAAERGAGLVAAERAPQGGAVTVPEAGSRTSSPVRVSPSDRLALAFSGAVIGGAAAWCAWWLVGRGELLVGVSVAGLAVVGALALWSAATGR